MEPVGSRPSLLGGADIIEPSLLDAHSFCWLLATAGRPKERRMPPRVRGHLRFFTGAILEAPSETGSPAADRAVNDCVVDMQAAGERRTVAGRVAEEIALKEEQNRLLHCRRPDLARRVKLVSDRPGLGYDIHSFERDGAHRINAQIKVAILTVIETSQNGGVSARRSCSLLMIAYRPCCPSGL